MPNAIIKGLGHYLPEKVVTNAEMEKMIETTDEWITERTGIKERRWFKPGFDTTSNMGTKAALMALEDAKISKDEIDFIIFATLSPDYNFPGCGVLVQDQLGIKEVGALDVRNQCSGFLYGLSVAEAYIKSGMYKKILLIGAETQTNVYDLSTKGRSLSVIFGDGAGAAVICAEENEDKRGILSTHLHSEGKYALELTLREPGALHPKRIYEGFLDDYDGIYPYMNGQNVFKHAVTRFPEVIIEALEKNNKKVSDIDILVPHQANLRISSYIQTKLGLRDDQVVNNIQKYGNTTAASIPIALSEATKDGRIKKGDLVCLAAFGSGFTWASALIKW
jgi:3-oxoacyl-[acyl-carrier-protein] synthase III